MTPKIDTFSERLRQSIGENSVSSFGKKCGIGESTLRQYLKGGTPGLDKVIAIAEASGVNIEWLATGEGPMRPGESVKETTKEEHQQPTTTQQASPATDYDNFRISEKMQKTVEILESDTIYRPALAANIDAFHHGMTQEKVVQDQTERIASLEARMAVLEKHLSSVTATPDNYQSNPKTNNNEAA